MAGGRPLKFKTAKALQQAVNKYFDDCDAKDEQYLVTGLAMALDVCLETITNYESRDEFLGIIKKAKARCIDQLWRQAMNGKTNPTMAIFISKVGHGMREKVDIDANVSARVIYQTVDIDKPDDTGISTRDDDDA